MVITLYINLQEMWEEGNQGRSESRHQCAVWLGKAEPIPFIYRTRKDEE